MLVSDKQLFDDLAAGKYKPIYLLTGEENYYIDIASQYFEQNIIANECRDFDQTILYGRDVDMSTVISYAKQFPMMSPVKLVLVKEAQDIPTKEWELICRTPCLKLYSCSATATRNLTNAPKPIKPSTTTAASSSAPNSMTANCPTG